MEKQRQGRNSELKHNCQEYGFWETVIWSDLYFRKIILAEKYATDKNLTE